MLDIALRIVNVNNGMNHIHRQDRFRDKFHIVNCHNGNEISRIGSIAELQE
jgi:hypothetical protein